MTIQHHGAHVVILFNDLTSGLAQEIRLDRWAGGQIDTTPFDDTKLQFDQTHHRLGPDMVASFLLILNTILMITAVRFPTRIIMDVFVCAGKAGYPAIKQEIFSQCGGF